MRSNSLRLRTRSARTGRSRRGDVSLGAVKWPPRIPRLLLVGADGETPAALPAAVGEDLTATLGAHPLAEAVRAQAARVVGLVGALHGSAAVRGGESAMRRPPSQDKPVESPSKSTALSSWLFWGPDPKTSKLAMSPMYLGTMYL